jgi:catechol 2,3-dioxygenase-like lactoylglutathione lyase family enzyme
VITREDANDSAAATVIERIDHVGIVVDDLGTAVAFYTKAFGMQVVSRESDTTVDSEAIGLPGHRVVLRGAILTLGGTQLEIHEYLYPEGAPLTRRVCDRGIGHLAFKVTDIDSAIGALSAHGVQFNAAPRLISVGDLSGQTWVYGIDPFGIVIELCQHPW